MGYEYFYGIQADQFTFYRVPKLFFTQEQYRCMTTDDKLLYGMLLDRMNLSAKNGWQDQQGRVYIIYPIEEIMSDMGCADNKATKRRRSSARKKNRKRQRRRLPTSPTTWILPE